MKRKVLRITTCCLVCAAMIESTSIISYAAPVSGVVTAMSSAETTGAATGAASSASGLGTATPGAGITLAMAGMLSGTSEEAKEQAVQTEVAAEAAQVIENPTETVASEYQDVAIAQVESYVNIRSEANEDSEVLGKLYNNSAATIVGTNEDGTWYQITSGSVTGYIKAEYLVVGDEALIKSVCRRIATVHTETLYVRALPSVDSPVIGLVPDQEDLTVTDETYVDSWGWVGVSIEEGSGYVSTEFVDLSTEYTYAESKEEEEARLAKEEAERAEAAAAASKTSKSSSSSSSTGSSSAAAPTSSGGSSVASYACQFVGNPYVFGGSSLTNGTDCSGFVMSVYAAFGVSLPHSSSAMRGCGYGVSTDAMQPGDIVCYSGHVGIYVGNDTIVHASTPSDGIKYTSPAAYRQILAVRRIF